MRLLLVAATEQEISPLLSEMKYRGQESTQLRNYLYMNRTIDVLITGVGMVATAAWVAQTLSENQYDGAINAGICGSFDRGIALGEVVRVQTDCIPELGAEDDEKFIGIHDLKLQDRNDFPFRNAVLTAYDTSIFGSLAQLKSVSGITVNKVHGNEKSIADVLGRTGAAIESMEGAAFLYACAIAGVPAIQVRAVSNYVEKRNRDAWKIADAVSNLNRELLKFFEPS